MMDMWLFSESKLRTKFDTIQNYNFNRQNIQKIWSNNMKSIIDFLNIFIKQKEDKKNGLAKIIKLILLIITAIIFCMMYIKYFVLN